MCRIMKNNLLAEEKEYWMVEHRNNRQYLECRANEQLFVLRNGWNVHFVSYLLFEKSYSKYKTVIKQIDEQMFCYTKSLSNDKKEMGAFTGEYSIVYMYQYVYTITKMKFIYII